MRRILLFDWDGTLHNTKHLYGCAFRKGYQWLTAQNLAPERFYSDDELSVYLGMNAHVMWQTFRPDLPENIREQVSLRVGNAMAEGVRQGKAVLYPGALQALTDLKADGYQLLLLSNCRNAYLEAHRSFWKLDQWFDGYYCCEAFGFLPKEQIFPAIAKEFPGEFLIIGDRASDLQIALTHHLPFLGCAYGFGTPGELAQADALAFSVQELPRLVRQLTMSNPQKCL